MTDPPASDDPFTAAFPELHRRAYGIAYRLLGQPVAAEDLAQETLARAYVAWSKVGDELKRGERFGMIRFGSRTEVYLPLSAKVLVKIGDRVKGGASVIAQLPE